MQDGMKCSTDSRGSADHALLGDLLDTAIAITEADFGTIQLLDAVSSDLTIVAQRGFPQWWLDYWNAVGHGEGACGAALARGARVIVEDVETSPIFIGSRALEIQRQAGVRAVQSTPVVSRSGRCRGMFSTHYRSPRRHDERTLRLLDLLACQLADIIDRADAIAALRENEWRYRTLVEAVSAVTWTCPPSGLQVEPQPEWMKFTGQSVEEMLGDGWTKVVHPEDLPVARSRWEAAMACSQPYASEHRLRRADGEWRWMSVHAVPLRDESGKVLSWHGMHIDISERKAVELKLAEREAEARAQALEIEAIYDSAPVGLCVIDRDLRLRRMNERLAAIEGISVEANLGKTIREVAPAIADVLEDVAKNVLETGQPMYDVEISGETPAQPGQRHFVEQWLPLRDSSGEVVAINVAVEEVTERKALEHELRKFEALAETSSQFIGLAGLDLKPSYVNAAGLALVGLENMEQVRELSIFSFFAPDEQERYRTTILPKLIQEGRVQVEIRFRNFKTGDLIWMLHTASTLKDEKGGITGYSTVSIDITDRKHAELKLRESEERLRLALAAGSMATWDWNIETGELLWNDQHFTLLGFTPGSVTPSYERWRSRVVSHDLARIEEAVQLSLRTGREYAVAFRILGKKDVIRWVEAYGRVEMRSEGKARRFYGVLFDITERVAREQDVRQRLEEIEALYDNAPIGLALLDEGLRYVRINEALARINGSTVAAHLSQTLDDMLPAAAPSIGQRLRNVLSSGKIVDEEVSLDLTGNSAPRYFREIFYPVREADGSIAKVGLIVEDITKRKAIEAQNATLLREINHRAKNLLSVTQSIAQLTAADEKPEKFYESFSSRLAGLAASHDLLVQAAWGGVSLDGLIKSQMRHLESLLNRRVFLKGPALSLSPSAVQMIGMAVHELATNSIKYGALSTAVGQVTICWSASPDTSEAGPRFVMTWTEEGGPSVVEPLCKGFGHAVTVEMPEHLFDAQVDLSFLPSGVVWKLTAPLGEIGCLGDQGGSPAH
jgi:PAS domain S-box-containing protein